MQIECPHCSKANNISVSQQITCGECKEEISGHLYRKYKKPLVSATTALMLGVASYHGVDKFLLDENRYPLVVEYSIVDSCVNSDSKIISKARYAEKKDVCLCALEKTMEELVYDDLKDDQQRFLSEFRSNTFQCLG